VKVLVIGAAGKSGRAVVEQALAGGHDVTAFVHETEGYLPASNVRVVGGDATDRPQWIRPCSGKMPSSTR